MRDFIAEIAARRDSEDGQAMVEYGLILAWRRSVRPFGGGADLATAAETHPTGDGDLHGTRAIS